MTFVVVGVMLLPLFVDGLAASDFLSLAFSALRAAISERVDAAAALAV